MVRICALHPPAARPGGSGVRTRGGKRIAGYSPTCCSRYAGHCTHVRNAHTDNVPESVELSALAHCTHRARAPVAAASPRTRGRAPISTLEQLVAATGAAAPMCAMHTQIMCQEVSNCPHLHIAITGRARQWRRRSHALSQHAGWVLSDSFKPLRGPSHPCAPCAHR